MKEKKVGDKVVFNYEVYEIENNIELVYDHTDILTGIIKEVIPSEIPGYTRYKVKVIGYVNVENERDYEFYETVVEVSDDKVYRGKALFDTMFPQLKLPTKEQIEYIQSFYNHKTGMDYSANYIIDNWYKTLMGDAYDEEEFE